jgi:hypothetical protein
VEPIVVNMVSKTSVSKENEIFFLDRNTDFLQLWSEAAIEKSISKIEKIAFKVGFVSELY